MKLLKITSQFLLCCYLLLSSSYVLAAASSSTLVDYSYLGTFTTEQAKAATQKVAPLNTLAMKYSLRLYKVHYKTPAPDGKLTTASGLIAMPIGAQKSVGMLGYFHGTRVLRTDVPSANDERNGLYLAAFGSSGGYMLVMPDYIGLGDNDMLIHPYVQADTLATSSIDMLVAAKEVAAELHYPLNDKLFLAGYSEGGFTTTVVYEEILKHHPELPVTAVSPGSAPYDWNETMRFVLLDPGPRSSAYLAYFFYSMQVYQHYWGSMNEIFKYPYQTAIPMLYDGLHTNQEVLDALPKNPVDLLDPALVAAITSGTDAHSKELEANFNHYNFTVTSPMLMVGTKGDHDVPYHGSEIAYQVLKSKSDMVAIKSVSDVLDHLTAFPVITKEQLEFFQAHDH